MTSYIPSDADAALFGNRFVTQEVPSREFPDDGHDLRSTRCASWREDLALEGDPARNLATFVTTWMEPEAQRIIAENLHRNFIDHAEYPRTAEIEQRCIRMLADLFHAPGETTGARTQGSSEAIMLGGAVAEVELAQAPRGRRRVRRRARTWCSAATCTSCGRSSAATSTSSRGSCRSQPGKYTIGPDDVAPARRREHHRRRGRARHHLHRPQGRHRRHQRPAACGSRTSAASTCRCTSTEPAAGSSGRSSTRTPPWDFRLEQVRSINVSGHKFGLVYPGIGWLIFREKSDLAQDLVFEENYLGKTDATFTLNFSTGSSMVLAQYYNLVRYGRAGYTYIMKNMQAERPRARREARGDGPLRDHRPRRGAAAAGRVPARRRRRATTSSTSPGSCRPSAAGWCPAYTLPPNAQDVTIMRALVKETMSREHVDTLARDIEEACATLARKGGAHESERAKIVTGPGH